MQPEPHTITYVIGDVHGMDNPFIGLVRAIVDDAKARSARPKFVFLGNVAGRGPNSERVLDAIITLLDRNPGSSLVLGNQERVFQATLLGELNEREFARWMLNCGQRRSCLTGSITSRSPTALRRA